MRQFNCNYSEVNQSGTCLSYQLQIKGIMIRCRYWPLSAPLFINLRYITIYFRTVNNSPITKLRIYLSSQPMHVMYGPIQPYPLIQYA